MKEYLRYQLKAHAAFPSLCQHSGVSHRGKPVSQTISHRNEC
jgi:hypothetical protein